MALIRVTPSNLRATAEELERMGKQMQAIVERLSDTEANLNGCWEGAANDAFHKAFLYDKDFMVMFYQLIAAYSNVMQQIAANYEQAESRNADLATRRNGGGAGSSFGSNNGGGSGSGTGGSSGSGTGGGLGIYPGVVSGGIGLSNIAIAVVYAAPKRFNLTPQTNLADIALKPFATAADMR